MQLAFALSLPIVLPVCLPSSVRHHHHHHPDKSQFVARAKKKRRAKAAPGKLGLLYRLCTTELSSQTATAAVNRLAAEHGFGWLNYELPVCRLVVVFFFFVVVFAVVIVLYTSSQMALPFANQTTQIVSGRQKTQEDKAQRRRRRASEQFRPICYSVICSFSAILLLYLSKSGH